MRAALAFSPDRKNLWKEEENTIEIPARQNDLGIMSFDNNSESSSCATQFTGRISLGNYGTNAITSIEIGLFLNNEQLGSSLSFPSDTSIASYSSYSMDIPSTSITGTELRTLEARVLSVNGASDTNASNDTSTKKVHYVPLATDAFAIEDFDGSSSSWFIPEASEGVASIVPTDDNSGKMLAFDMGGSTESTYNKKIEVYGPRLDLSSLESDRQAILSFRYYYRGSPEEVSSILSVFNSVGCGRVRSLLYRVEGLDINTSPTRTIGEQPQQDSDWRTVHIALGRPTTEPQQIVIEGC